MSIIIATVTSAQKWQQILPTAKWEMRDSSVGGLGATVSEEGRVAFPGSVPLVSLRSFFPVPGSTHGVTLVLLNFCQTGDEVTEVQRGRVT